jgi:hypothetical protein
MRFHAAGESGGGWRIIEGWESRQGLEEFVTGTLRPAIAELTGGDAPEFEPEAFEIYFEGWSAVRRRRLHARPPVRAVAPRRTFAASSPIRHGWRFRQRRRGGRAPWRPARSSSSIAPAAGAASQPS